MKRASLVLLALTALCLISLPAMADITLFTDLGLPGNQYQAGTGWTVSGTGTVGTSFTAANAFTVSGSGSFNVTQIDLGVGYVVSPPTFYASIWTDVGGLPGSPGRGRFLEPADDYHQFRSLPTHLPGQL